MNSPHIVKLYSVEKDKDYIYLLLEHCEGDLITYQSQFKDKTIPLEKAVEVLTDIIKGLESLHHEGYLHRDVKNQNILIMEENGRQVPIF
jgi:eukaryotic-like serine/threonine-protein kinase